MAEETLHLPADSLEYHILTLFEKLETLRVETQELKFGGRSLPLRTEARTLDFWKAVLCECLASFCYIFIVCGAATGAGAGASIASILLATALSAGFAMATLTQCFGHVSGAHINPAVTVAMGMTKNISMLRTIMYVVAQCSGAVAGAAFLYGVTIPGYQGNLSVSITHTASVATWERFGVELILSFVVVLTYFMTMNNYRKYLGGSALSIGAAYAACSFVSMPYLNPARSLGPSFVLSKWDSHWVYWIGPLIGGIISGLTFEYIFNPRRQKRPKDSADGETSSIRSDEDTYDDLDKQVESKFAGSSYNTYRSGGGNVAGYCPSLTSASLYSAAPSKLERVESLYGGTKSLYCKSPPLTRANLNRSQSVYAKSNSGVNRDTLPRPGPLVPAQSLYPIRLNQQSHVQNQNVQNQLQQRSESIYGMRGAASGAPVRGDQYGPAGYPARNDTENEKVVRAPRPESLYGPPRRNQSAPSDDSNYSSYHGSTSRSVSNTNANFHPNYNSKNGNNYNMRGAEVRQAPTTSTASSYHHNLPQHSPPSQY